MSWAGVATFAASFNGHVVLIDSWIPRGPSTTWNHSLQYVGTSPDEYKALAPEAYFIGHMHGDHAGDAPRVIEANPDMAVYGNQNHCDDLKAEVKADDPSLKFNCFARVPVGAGRATGAPCRSRFGMVDNLPANTIPGVKISAVMHPHSLAPSRPGGRPAVRHDAGDQAAVRGVHAVPAERHRPAVGWARPRAASSTSRGSSASVTSR